MKPVALPAEIADDSEPTSAADALIASLGDAVEELEAMGLPSLAEAVRLARAFTEDALVEQAAAEEAAQVQAAEDRLRAEQVLRCSLTLQSGDLGVAEA